MPCRQRVCGVPYPIGELSVQSSSSRQSLLERIDGSSLISSPFSNAVKLMPGSNQGCQQYGFFRKSTEFRKRSVFHQIFYGFCNFLIFFNIFIVIGNHNSLRPWSSWTANSDKKFMELNGAALNVYKPCATFQKTAFLKDKLR